MRLIDADALKHTFCSECVRTQWCEDCDINYHFEHLALTVDAVEVVRCKDCKYYWKNKPSNDVPVCLASPKDDAFCSEGERKEDGD